MVIHYTYNACVIYSLVYITHMLWLYLIQGQGPIGWLDLE